MPKSDPSSSAQSSDPPPRPTGERHSTSPETSFTSIRTRSPTSPDTSSTADGVGLPPIKRARKAVNCGPCRASKLKCDRERPCSSCKLRGTTASCYQGQDEGSPTTIRGNDTSDPRNLNVALEFCKIRRALTLVETYVNCIQRSPASPASILAHEPSFDVPVTLPPVKCPTTPQTKQDLAKSDLPEQEAAPGALGQSNSSGFYAGPTSTVSYLTSDYDIRAGSSAPGRVIMISECMRDVCPAYDSDYDLLKGLPHTSVIEGLVDFYFEQCNWVYRHVNRRAFMDAWSRYKTGARADRIVLGTVCMIMAVTLHYLPAGHELLRSLPPDIDELGTRFYNIMRLALQRNQAESRAYTLELVELLLSWCHYLSLSKTDSEEIWHVKGELVNIATAMGLHRDPGKEMSLEVAERRRWAWWHVILYERWQSFLFGRPITIASHHFDTRLPLYCDPEVDPSGRLYEPNIHLFRLAFILGDIMDDAVSLRPVPYESVLKKDRILQEWWDTLPTELDMDDHTLAGYLASSTTSKRRIGVQSVIFRTAFLHIRFTMHRPFASLAHGEPSKYAPSLKISVKAADKLIALTSYARPEMLNHAALAVPGHMSWGPLHCFSAAMFFCFQIINNPEQLGAGLFRANVLRAVTILESCRGMPIAEKALDILHALGPLYADAFLSDTLEVRELKKQTVLPAVRRLQFPYHDSPNVQIDAIKTRGTRSSTVSPARSSTQMESPGTDATQPPPGVQRTVHDEQQEAEMLSIPPPAPSTPILQTHQQHLQQQRHHTCENLPSLKWPHADLTFGNARYPGQQQQQGHEPLAEYQDATIPHQPEEAMWQSYHAQHGHATAAMVPPEPTSTSRPLYTTQIIQDVYPQGGDCTTGPVGGRMGTASGGAEGVLWGATSGFVQGAG